MTLAILATTYNEKDNIVAFIEAVEQELARLSCQSYLIIADGQSPDGTGEQVTALQAKFPNLKLLTKPKAGIGAAYNEALPYVFDVLNVDVVVTMDADFSHQPQDIAVMVKNLERGADLVIGSRYIAGGSIPAEWAWYRKVLSGLGNLVVRILFGTWQIHEYTTAFRAFSKELWNRLDKSKLQCSDNTFLPAFVYESYRCQAKIVEVPVDFKERVAGKSKIEIGRYTPNLLKYALGIFIKRCTGVIHDA